MLTLTVTRHNGQAPAQALSADFDAAGGTIGRAGSNLLVLEDAERTVSRVHAQIVWRDGRYRLVDRGSNPALVNGTPLEPGQEIVVADGDEVQIGGYQLRARVAQGEHAGHAHHAFESTPGPANPDDPFADIFGAPARHGNKDTDAAHTDAADTDTNLDDFFRSDRPASGFPTPIGNPPPALADDFDLGLNDPAANRSIDELFGLGSNANASSGGARGMDYTSPVPSPVDAPLSERNTAGNADPFAALTGALNPVVPPATLPDRGSELHSAFAPPRLRRAAQTPAEGASAAQTTPAPWDKPESLPQRSTAQSPTDPALAPWDIDEPPASGPRQEPQEARVAREAAPQTRPPADTQALLQAFLRGLDAPAVQLDALTPAVMQQIGALLHEATQGTLDLLVARAITKRELHSEATMIVATGNNPLKFSPNVETALAHLLHPPTRGFMEGSAALRDAYEDLRAHQVGFVTGMRAALDGVFERFEPSRIEARFTRHSMLDALFAQRAQRAGHARRARRARCWDLFVEQYAQLSQEATDDFHALFGKAFVTAYEEQIERLKKKKP